LILAQVADEIVRIEVAFILGCFTLAASTIAWLVWRTNRQIARRLADLAEQCEKAESDRAGLLRTLSLRDSEENERISRLEHDVKSSLGVILGFSSLLRESAEQDAGRSSLPLKNINAIHQAATKIVRIIDAAVQARNSRDGQAIIANGKS
jgi:signal transduction histidine kinase